MRVSSILVCLLCLRNAETVFPLSPRDAVLLLTVRCLLEFEKAGHRLLLACLRLWEADLVLGGRDAQGRGHCEVAGLLLRAAHGLVHPVLMELVVVTVGLSGLWG